mgnify:CR=1 FL=1
MYRKTHLQQLEAEAIYIMREVAAQVATVDPMKIAILAALNIADEFSRYRRQREDAAGIWIERTEEITERLSKVIS